MTTFAKLIKSLVSRVKLELEYIIKSSPTILYQYISTPSGLVEWFCDDVNIKKSDQYTFIWDGDENPAKLIKKVNGKFIKFEWENGEDDEYFQMQVTKDEMTGDVSLIIEDWLDEEDYDEMVAIWDNQISDLKAALGVT
jgi:uncharacterized protein YndB with AHSA1/START domain